MQVSKHNATKKIEVPLTEANFRVLLQPLCREGTEGWVCIVIPDDERFAYDEQPKYGLGRQE